MSSFTRSSVIALCALWLSMLGQHQTIAQTYGVDAQTDPSGFDRLFSSSTLPTVPAPLDSFVWFVADTLNNGVPTTTAAAGVVLGPDDVLVFQDVIPGEIFLGPPGQYVRSGVSVSQTLATANVYFYLWNRQATMSQPTLNPADVVAGDTFGLFSIGVVSPPGGGVGNALWNISGNVFADQYTVVAIPEPGVMALTSTGLLLAAWLRHRRCRR
jgi:hypothetical protein